MPNRRGVGAGFSAGLQDIGQSFGRLSSQYSADRLQRRQAEDQAMLQDRLERERKADELIQSGKLKPQDREAFIKGQQAGPSVGEKIAGMLGDITKAPTFQQVPGVTALANEAEAQDIPTTAYGTMARDVGGPSRLPSTQSGPISSPEFNTLTKGREEKLNAFASTPEDYVDTEGLRRRRYVASRPDVQTGRDVPMEPTPAQAGANKQTELLTGELSGPVITARASQAGQEQGARTKAQQQAEIASSGMTAQQQSAAMTLSDNFTQESRGFYTVQDQMRQMGGLMKEHTPASDLGMIFAFNKILDSMGSVREGEQERVAAATSLTQRIEQWFARQGTGTILPDALRNDLLRQSRNMFNSAAVEHQRRVVDYSQRAAAFHINPQLVVRPVAPDLAPGAQGPSAIDILKNRP